MFDEPSATPLQITSAAASFDTWYEAHHPRLVRSLLLTCNGNGELAADAVDEAMARAFERWHRVGAMESPEAWTYRVAANHVKRVFRRRGGEQRALAGTVPLAEGFESPVPSPVWDAVRALKPRERDAITLRYVLGFSEAEIATALKVKVGTASALLSRARSHLRQSLSQIDGGVQ